MAFINRYDEPKKKPKTFNFFHLFISLIILTVIIIAISNLGDESSNKTNDDTQKTETKVLTPNEQAEIDAQAKAEAEAGKELDADIKYDSTTLIITNKETQDWTGCRIVLNSKIIGSDYSHQVNGVIGEDNSYIILMNEFAKKDGTRFNPYYTKVKNLFISCDVEGNQRDAYYETGE